MLPPEAPAELPPEPAIWHEPPRPERATVGEPESAIRWTIAALVALLLALLALLSPKGLALVTDWVVRTVLSSAPL